MTTRRLPLTSVLSLSLLGLALVPAAGCADDGDPSGDVDDETSGDGDGDPDPSGDGDGDPDPSGDGDGDPDPSGDGDGDPDPSGDGDPTDGEDLTPPTVVMTSPAADATGVLADAVIEISFSEAMDKASVQTAWQSSELPASEVTFGWNAEGTVLTVTPNAPLAIAEIATLDDPAESFAFALDGIATDLAGNPLDPALDVSFSTARRWTTSIEPYSEMTKYVGSNGSVGPFELDNRVGDNAGNVAYRTFVSYALGALPADLLVLESAHFHLEAWSTIGDPFEIDNGLGAINLHAVDFEQIDNATYNLVPADGDLVGSVLAMLNPNEIVKDVTAWVVEDVDAMALYTQFRLATPTPTNDDDNADYVTIHEADIPLEVTVLIP